MTSSSHDHATPSSRRSWAGLSVLCLPTAVLALDMSVLYLALPHISAALGADATDELWILDVYPLLIAGLLVPMGGLGDRIGRRRLLLGGAAVFAVVSMVAAFSANAGMLIAARAALGVAGATLMPTTLGLLHALFPDPRRRRTAIAVWSSAFMTGFATGPLIGGALLEAFWWGAVFLPAVPVMVLLLVTGPTLLPECRRTESGRFDPLSAVLFLTGLLPLVHGLKEFAHGGSWWTASVAVGVGLLAVVAFVRRQYRLDDPLLDPRLLTDRTVATALLLLLSGPAVIGGLTLFVPQYLQLTRGLTALQAGAAIAPAALGLIVGALVAPTAARRFPTGVVIGTGLALGCGGLLMVAFGVTASPVWVIVGLTVVYLGSGPCDALGTDLVVGAAPPGEAGSAGAAGETASELGTGLGIALLGTLGTAVYQSRVVGSWPAELPGEVAVAAGASLSEARSVLETLDADRAEVLARVVEAAFASGVRTVSLVGAVITACLAVLAVRGLRT
ncbi:MFS transporter [Nocardiopsis sp. MG754419]|uniref:MFS transporter n=1 Tax=Nocardiopsis sp. MG754419 TaxID=2259865 RepID=UPI001BAD3FBD|nr:MFS transporter [Nocardiopsis sp. MG754419]MBR8743913.1 MFS transporter [Nocardiopsis sp. MG754419]